MDYSMEKLKISIKAKLEEEQNEVVDGQDKGELERRRERFDSAIQANKLNLAHIQIRHNTFLRSTTTLPVGAHSSHEPLENLQPITFSQMQTAKLYEGRFLACRVLADTSIKEAAVLCEDITGAVELVAFVNFVPALLAFDLIFHLRAGKIMFIKEPTTLLVEGSPPFVMVESPSDMIFVRESDSDLLRLADALSWHRPEASSFDWLKEKGNQMFKRDDYNAALDFYERALAVSPSPASSAIIHLNMAAALLPLDRFYEANEHAMKALEMGGTNREKILFRLGKAAYGMRSWQKAVDHFQGALAENGQNAAIAQELRRAKARLRESQTGEYDLKMLYDQTSKAELEQTFDVADYVGPVEVVDIQGNAKGLVVTEDVQKGTLLLVSKAYARCEDYEGDSGTALRQAIDCVYKLKLNPQTSDQFYALYAGEQFNRDKLPPAGVLDIGRIVRTNVENNFEDCSTVGTNRAEANNSCGLWLLPSFINHSCIPTSIRIQFGDMLFLRALVDLAKGEEVTLSYVFINNSFGEREEALKKRNFQCQCQMCVLDRADPSGDEEREKMYDKALAIKSTLLQNPNKPAQYIRAQIDSLNTLLRQIALSYDAAQRPNHLRLQQSLALFTLCEVHSELGNVKMAAETHAQIEQFVRMPIGNFWMGMEFYKSRLAYCLVSKQQEKAKEAAKAAFEYVKLYAGIKQKKLFVRIYPEFERHL